MCQHCLSRRAFLGRGLGSVAGLGVGGLGALGVGAPPTAGVAGGVRAAASLPEPAPGSAPPAASHLDVALEAWRWIHASQVVTDHGLTWPADPTDPSSIGDTLYTHGIGVIPFILELFHTTQDQQYLDVAMAGVDHVAAGIDDIAGSGLYVGLGGAAFVFEETFRASGRRVHRDYAARATDVIVRRAQSIGEGLAWPTDAGGGAMLESNDIVSGTAGTILTLLYLGERLAHTAAVETARRAGYRLIEKGIAEPTGLRWDIYDGYAREMPNFSHGTAGISYALVTLAGPTSESEFLDAGLAGASYLRSIATLGDDDYLIMHNSPEGENLFYLAWCHGPVGTNRLFHQLHTLTGDESWRDWVVRGARGIMNTGVPEHRTAGFWENVSQCGGSAGIGDYFLTLHRLTGEPEYRAFVDRLNADLMSRSTVVGDGRAWIQSEHRVRPDLLVAQTGYMQGAAGIGKYFLHMHGMAEQGTAPAIVLPDAPY